MTSVLHVVSWLTRGGPGYALVTASVASSACGGTEHAVVSLKPPDPEMVRQAQLRGLRVHHAPDLTSVSDLMAAADIVQVEFWNSPALYQMLGSELPEMRMLLWSHVTGEYPPQVMRAELVELPDVMLASCEHTTTLPGFEGLDWIPAVTDRERIRARTRTAGRKFTVGYVGKIDFSKLHPDFIGLCASIEVPEARFILCGEGGALGGLRRQAAERGIAERIEFRGFVDDIGSALAEMDVFGYPIAPDCSPASELSLQEAMYAGIPPVVLGSAAVCRHVVDGTTGIVARTGQEYCRAISYLYLHPEERLRIGSAARQYAMQVWSPDAVGSRWAGVYEALAARPKRRRRPLQLADSGAGRFVENLGDAGGPFTASMSAGGAEAVEAEERIARCSAVICNADGGILSYRDFYREDPHLRLWSGLVLRQQGRPAVAAGEFAAAIRHGLDDPGVRRRLADAARAAGAAGDLAPTL